MRTLSAPSATAFWALSATVLGAVAGMLAAGFGHPARLVLAILGVLVSALVIWRFEIGAVLMVATLPLDEYGRVLSIPVTVTVFHLVLLLTLGSWIASLAWREDVTVRYSWVDLGIGALVAAALWSLPNSLARGATILAIVRVLAMWAFSLFYANALRRRRVAEWVVVALVATGVASALLAIAQYVVPGFGFGSIRLINEGGGSFLRRVGALFHDPNFLATFLSIALVASAVMLVHERRIKPALVWAACSVVLLGGIAFTFSRTAMVGFAVAAVAIVATAPKSRRAALAAVGVALVLAVALLAPGQVLERAVSIGEVGYNNSNATRFYMVGSTVEIAKDYWVSGTGLAAFDRAYPPYRQLGSLSTILKPHQLPLAIVAEMGVAGLIAEIMLVAGVIAVLWRRRARGWGRYEALAVAGLVSVVIQSLFQYYLYFEYLWLMIAFAVAGPVLAIEEEVDDRAALDGA